MIVVINANIIIMIIIIIIIIIYIIIIILLFWEFFTPALADSFHLSLSDSKSPQDSRTLFSILADLNNVVVWKVSTRPLISKSSRPCKIPSVIILRALIIIRITVTFMFILIIIIVNSLHACFFTPDLTGVFYRSRSSSNSLQVSRTHHSILTNMWSSGNLPYES